MKKSWIYNFFKYSFLLIFSFYLFLVFLFPYILNSNFFISHFIDFLQTKTKNHIELKELKFSISPKLNFKGYASEVLVYDNNKILNLRALTFDFCPLSIKKLPIIHIDNFYYKNLDLNSNKKNSKKRINFTKLPDLYVNHGIIELGIKKHSNYIIDIHSLKFKTAQHKKELTFNSSIKSRFFNDEIKIFDKNILFFNSHSIYTNNFTINFNNSIAQFSGKIFDFDNSPSFTFFGGNLPVLEIVHGYLLISKQFNPKKNFIENFTNFDGKIDITLDFNQNGAVGKARIKDLRADALLFNVPIYFKKADFIFDKTDIFLQEYGSLGGKTVFVDFLLSGLFSDNVTTFGTVLASINMEFAKKYIDGLSVDGNVNLDVDYYVNKGIVDVIYKAQLNKGADLSYLGARLGLSEYKRKIFATTRKKDETITMTNYSYSVQKENEEDNELVSGNAKFIKKNGKYLIDKIYLQTKKDAPVSLLGFLENRLDGGFFNGDFIFDFNLKKFLGSITLSNSKFKHFYIEDGAIFGDDRLLNIILTGSFKNEFFSANIDILNKIQRNLHIKSLDLYLKKLVLDDNDSVSSPKIPTSILKDYYSDLTIDKLTVRLDEFRRGNLLVQNISFNGELKNHIFNFSIPDIFYAKGILGGFGSVDFKNKLFSFDFSAKKLDSNIVAYEIFNLKDQIKGLVDAKLYIEGSRGISSIKGKGEFRINDGSITHFSEKKFTIKRNSKKPGKTSSISKIIKVKTSKINPSSDITGFFDINNKKIQNLNLYLQNDALSVFIEGFYIPNNSYADFDVWGMYDGEVQNSISIFHIPLSLITKILFKKTDIENKFLQKIKKIPPIKAEIKNIEKFRVILKGDLNKPHELDIKLKRFRKINKSH